MWNQLPTLLFRCEFAFSMSVCLNRCRGALLHEWCCAPLWLSANCTSLHQRQWDSFARGLTHFLRSHITSMKAKPFISFSLSLYCSDYTWAHTHMPLICGLNITMLMDYQLRVAFSSIEFIKECLIFNMWVFSASLSCQQIDIFTQHYESDSTQDISWTSWTFSHVIIRTSGLWIWPTATWHHSRFLACCISPHQSTRQSILAL